MTLQEKPILVLKFGTASITNENGVPNEEVIANIAKEVSELHKKYFVVIVSSGAVGAGKGFIKDYKGELIQRKAAAAIGNLALIGIYAREFNKYGVQVAQSLCERGHFADRKQFLQLKSTYQELWKNGIIPIANENDVVSSRELQFSDNDELATIIAAGFGAKKLMICTKSGGLLDAERKIIPLIADIDKETMKLVDNKMSTSGLGGMASKLTFTKRATAVGIEVIVFGMNENGGILLAFEGKAGTKFLPKTGNVSVRNKWLASGSVATGQVVLDEGAVSAVKKRKSLLSVGVKAIKGEFQVGEFIELLNTKKESIAVAKSKLASNEFNPKVSALVAHADDIVLL